MQLKEKKSNIVYHIARSARTWQVSIFASMIFWLFSHFFRRKRDDSRVLCVGYREDNYENSVYTRNEVAYLLSRAVLSLSVSTSFVDWRLHAWTPTHERPPPVLPHEPSPWSPYWRVLSAIGARGSYSNKYTRLLYSVTIYLSRARRVGR